MNNPKRKPLVVPNRYASMERDFLSGPTSPSINTTQMGGEIEEVVVRPPRVSNLVKQPSMGVSLKSPQIPDSLSSLADQANDSKTKPNLKGAIPYASNVVNSFITPKRQLPPRLQSSINLGRVDLSGARSGIAQRLREHDLGTSNLDGNSGAYVRTAGLAKGMQSLADIDAQEANMNVDIGNREAAMNSDIEARNLSALNQYQDNIIGRDSAIKRNFTANLSNAADKYVASENLKTDRETDLAKVGILAAQHESTGVYGRTLDKMVKSGYITDDMYKSLSKPKMRFGGQLKKAF